MTTKWPVAALGDLCDLATGGTPDTKIPEYHQNGNIPWLVSGDVHKGEIFECDGRITELGMKHSNARLLTPNSVLIALAGQGKTRGTVALLRISASCNQSVVAMTPKDPRSLLPEYLFWNLRARYVEIRRMSGDDEKDRRGLNMRMIRSIVIPLPPLDEQKRIVAKLDAAQQDFDRLNNNLEQQLNQLTEFDSALLSEMLVNPGQTPETAVSKWPVLPLSEVSELITRGITPKYASEAGVIVINQRCIRDQSVNLDSARLHDADVKPVADSKCLQHGDGLVNSTGVGTLGRTAVFDSKTVDGRVTVDSHVTIVRPKQGLFAEGFLRYALELCEGAFVEHSTGSGGQTELSRSAIGNELITLPSLDEQIRIVAKLDEASLASSSLRLNIIDRKKSASELQLSILAAAFAGEL